MRNYAANEHHPPNEVANIARQVATHSLFDRRHVCDLDTGGLPATDARSVDRCRQSLSRQQLRRDGTRLAVRLMGESASVSVDGAAAIDLPAIGKSGTTFSNGRQTMLIEQGRNLVGYGARHAVACTGG